MKKSKFTEEQIVYALKQAEAGVALTSCAECKASARHVLPLARQVRVSAPPSSSASRSSNHIAQWTQAVVIGRNADGSPRTQGSVSTSKWGGMWPMQ